MNIRLFTLVFALSAALIAGCGGGGSSPAIPANGNGNSLNAPVGPAPTISPLSTHIAEVRANDPLTGGITLGPGNDVYLTAHSLPGNSLNNGLDKYTGTRPERGFFSAQFPLNEKIQSGLIQPTVVNAPGPTTGNTFRGTIWVFGFFDDGISKDKRLDVVGLPVEAAGIFRFFHEVQPVTLISGFGGPASGEALTIGSDHNLWGTFNESFTGQIFKVDLSSLPSNAVKSELTSSKGFGAITNGPDGRIWAATLPPILAAAPFPSQIFRIDTNTGSIMNTFDLPAGSQVAQITGGPDGALWFTDIGLNKIGRITTTGAETFFPLPTAGSAPDGIAVGPDGALWFTERRGAIGRITTAGTISEFTLPTPGRIPVGIINGTPSCGVPALLFAEEDPNQTARGALGQVLF